MCRYIIIMLSVISLTAGAAGPVTLLEDLPRPIPANPEVVMQELTLPPGFEGGPHRHNAWLYIYVVDGAVDMQLAGEKVTRVAAGEVFVETPGDVHLMMKNSSDTEQVRFVVFFIKEEGAPLVLPANRDRN